MSSDLDIIDGVTIGPATIEDFNEVFLDTALHARIIEGLHGYSPEFNSSYMLISYGKYKQLGTYRVLGNGFCEVHIACPKDSVLASRLLTFAAMRWLLEIKYPELQGLVTTCPDSMVMVRNALYKLGFKKITFEGSSVYLYIAPSPSLST